ncbi:MAG: prolipoprotein diacylglyceryl transferase [Polyangiaceae bacterium]
MAEPLIPYLDPPEIPLGFLLHVPGLGSFFDAAHPPSIKPFGTLVALGVYIGAVVAKRRAAERKLDPVKMTDLIFWTVAAGFIGGHVLDAIFYHPSRIAHDPTYLLRLWDGLSSYGGFIGALIGAWLWRWIKGHKILPYGDVICSALPIGWMFGRAGCAVVHDHPGALSDAWFAVRYPYGPGYIGRFDLGLYECLLTIPLAVGFAIAWRRDPFRPNGFYAGWMCVAYAPVRFFLDFLRVDARDNPAGDPRYGGLTPAQWACFGLLAVGIYILSLAKKGPRTEPPAETDAPPDTSTSEARVADEDAPTSANEERVAEQDDASSAS